MNIPLRYFIYQRRYLPTMHETELSLIAQSYFSEVEVMTIYNISIVPDFQLILEFDRYIGGIGLFNVNKGRTGRYHVEDRDIFRPLQYIYMNLETRHSNLSWYTRDIIHMCGLHLEAIIKRFTGKYKYPLGKNLFDKKLTKTIDQKLLMELNVIAKLFNAAKHDVSHYKDEHLFSIADAIYCYFLTRKLASQLYPFIMLNTTSEVWKE